MPHGKIRRIRRNLPRGHERERLLTVGGRLLRRVMIVFHSASGPDRRNRLKIRHLG